MKRLYYMLLAVASALVSESCSLDDNGVNFHYTTLETVSAELPESFEFGRIYTINVTLFRPDDCTLTETFDVRRSATDTTNIRTVAAVGIVLDKEDCTQVDEEIQDSFQFEVLYTQPYIFRFYTGDNENGDAEFLEIEVPVDQNP